MVLRVLALDRPHQGAEGQVTEVVLDGQLLADVLTEHVVQLLGDFHQHQGFLAFALHELGQEVRVVDPLTLALEGERAPELQEPDLPQRPLAGGTVDPEQLLGGHLGLADHDLLGSRLHLVGLVAGHGIPDHRPEAPAELELLLVRDELVEVELHLLQRLAGDLDPRLDHLGHDALDALVGADRPNVLGLELHQQPATGVVEIVTRGPIGHHRLAVCAHPRLSADPHQALARGTAKRLGQLDLGLVLHRAEHLGATHDLGRRVGLGELPHDLDDLGDVAGLEAPVIGNHIVLNPDHDGPLAFLVHHQDLPVLQIPKGLDGRRTITVEVLRQHGVDVGDQSPPARNQLVADLHRAGELFIDVRVGRGDLRGRQSLSDLQLIVTPRECADARLGLIEVLNRTRDLEIQLHHGLRQLPDVAAEICQIHLPVLAHLEPGLQISGIQCRQTTSQHLHLLLVRLTHDVHSFKRIGTHFPWLQKPHTQTITR